MLDLINEIQPSLPWSAEHLRWQFFDNPAGDALLYAIEDGGRLVSLYAAIPHWVDVSTSNHRAYMVQDVMTHGDYRGRGYLNYLASQCKVGIQEEGAIGYTFPNKLSENSFRRSQWTELMRVPYRSVKIDAVTLGEQDTDVSEVSSFPERVSDIWASSGLVVGVRRDKPYLDWRYGRPDATYHRFILGADEGFLVLKLYRSGDQWILHICDLLAVAENPAMVPRALTFVSRFAQENRAVTITCWMPENHPYARSLDAFGLGFVPDHDRFGFVLPPDSLASTVCDPANWHLTQGDSDVY